MKNIVVFITIFIYCGLTNVNAQQQQAKQLINQGVWFLASTTIEEKDGDTMLTQTEYFKKDDISSIFFDEEKKVYTVFSKLGTDVMEDRWQMVDDSHFVMVGPDDGSSQFMEIVSLSPTKLEIKSCNDIEGIITCTLFVYHATKDKWLSDQEIDKLNAVAITETVIPSEEISE